MLLALPTTRARLTLPHTVQVVEDEVGGVGVGVDDGVSGGVDGAPRSEQAVFEAIAPTPSGIQVGQGVMVGGGGGAAGVKPEILVTVAHACACHAWRVLAHVCAACMLTRSVCGACVCVQVCDLWIDVEGAPDAHAVGAELRDCGPSLQVPPDMYLLMYCVTKVGAYRAQ